MEEGRKCSLHTYSCSHLASEAGPSTSFALDGKRKHENEMGERLGMILHNQKKATRPPQLPCSSHLGGVADLPLTTFGSLPFINMRTHSVLHVKVRPALTQRQRGTLIRRVRLRRAFFSIFLASRAAFFAASCLCFKSWSCSHLNTDSQG